MASAYTGELRVRLPDGYDPPAELLAFGRKALGALLEYAGPNDLKSIHRRHELPDGSVVTVSFDGTLPVMEITPALFPTTESNPVLASVWVPRGFVIQTATAAYPGGVGLPALPAADNPEDPTNLKPGTDMDRWTAGGPAGEVLITRDSDAGFPSVQSGQPAPLLYDDTKGPRLLWSSSTMTYDARPYTGEWKAYRLEFSPWSTMFDDEVVATKRSLWNAINEHRTDLGLQPVTLWPRGYYLPGQTMASIMFTNGDQGASSDAYPVTYRTVPDRATKDGYPQYTLYASALAGRDSLTGFSELRSNGGVIVSMEAWLDDPDASAIIERDAIMHLDPGTRGGFLAASFEERDAWIMAGNCSWAPADGHLPPLSWYGFRSMNLAFETWPVTFGATAGSALVQRLPFTNSQHECWLKYYRTADQFEPAMGHHVYMRGRAIGLAPQGSLVWGATITDNGDADRLIILTHHWLDQPSDHLTSGMTRYLRVWYCDVPKRKAMRLNPNQVITGTDVNDPLSWRGGELIDVGSAPSQAAHPVAAPNSLKYASQWRFSSDGARAVCLRDYGSAAEYRAMNNPEEFNTLTLTGLGGVALELVFSVPADGSLSTSVEWQPLLPCFTAQYREVTAMPLFGPLPPIANINGYYVEFPVVPVAVDYDESDRLLYAFWNESQMATPLVTFVYYIGTGYSDVIYPSDIGNLVAVGASDLFLNHLSSTGDFMPSRAPVVCDIRSAAFAASGVRVKFTKTAFFGPTLPWMDGQNPDYTACVSFTDLPIHGVRAWRAGQLLKEKWYPCPDGVIVQVYDICDSSQATFPVNFVRELVTGISQLIQGSYAERAGEWMFAVQVSPQPAVARIRNNDNPDVDIKDCGCQTSYLDYTSRTHSMTPDELRPRGGQFTSSFAVPDIASGTWLISAKAV